MSSEMQECLGRAMRVSAWLLGLIVALAMQQAHAQGSPSQVGQWSPIYAWPDVAIHLHLLPNGKVLSFADDDHEEFETKGTRAADFTKAFVVDIPAMQPPGNVVYVPNSTTNLFCSAHTFLPDGRLLVMGGHEGRDNFGSRDTNILTYKGSNKYSWRRQGDSPMSAGRWYPTGTGLANGEIVVVGGTRGGTGDINPLPEVWMTGSGGGWRALTTALLAVPLYSPMHLAPNGKLFMSGSAQLTRYLDTSGTGAWTNVGNRLYGDRNYGSSVMYEPGKVLVMGGGDPPTATAETIDLNQPSPVWRWAASMHVPRRQQNATILPDGKVLVTGGTSSAGFNNGTLAVRAAEVWDPQTGTWTTWASAQVPRLYHSAAILLPDGRVLSAGGGRPHAAGVPDHEDVEIFSPPYLFKGARPRVSSAPQNISYGQPFSVGTPDAASIASVTLVRLSSASHALNMNQRFNRLVFARASNGVNVTPPSDRKVAPPGHYMLFLLNSTGVPSLARIVRLS